MTQAKDDIKTHDVDLKIGIIGGVLKQIRRSNDTDPDVPELMKVWSCDIKPKQTKDLLAILREFNEEEQELKHLKRFTKINDDTIRGIICLQNRNDQNETILKHVRDLKPERIEIIEVPKYPAFSKEASLRWSSIWPMLWKGNPNHQFLNEVKYDMSQEKKMLSELLKQLVNNESRQVSATIMARSINNELVIQASATSGLHSSPSEHSIMKVIESIAESEISSRRAKVQSKAQNGYLCTGMIVYTTHEPCVMCSMALIHSRIERLTYLKPIKKSGGIESSYYLGDMDGLNWKFPIWRWLGESELKVLDEIDDNIESIDY
ncbi:TAD3 [Candida pseudojiufengensis]|uniref:TAD3 n=1 Tax=Candida pseudojiufengensis TaxID=497109 RepID=UPI002224E86A|nr:TAD3 [Candida pseudojiufengensis]KAI5963341.1 TAD3 [Candida pseudojiufengensis]